VVEAPVQLRGEQDVLELGGAVRAVRREVPVVVQVVEVEVPEEPRAHAGRLDDRGAAREELVQEQAGQEERREVVDLERPLVSVDGPGAVAAEDAAGVVRQDVDARVGGVELGGQATHVGEVREVGDEALPADLAGDVRGLLR
jgi:hypothetical protein